MTDASAMTPDEAAQLAGLLQDTMDYADRITDGQANTLYAHAYQLHERGRHDQAAAVFMVLCRYRPREARYPFAAGVCYRKLGRLTDAIANFARAGDLQANYYAADFQMIESALLLGRRKEVLPLLELLERKAREQNQTKAADRAASMLEFQRAAPA
jgi:tetratricopeptide (TPR) repeat protein